MKFALLFILSIALNLVIFAQAPPPANDYFPKKWSEHVFPEYGFAARFPRTPKKTLEAGNATADPRLLATLGLNNPRFLSYAVSVFELKQASADRNEAGALAEILKKAELAAGGVGAKVLKSDPIEIPGVDAQYFEIGSAGKRIRKAAVVRGRLLYFVSFTAPADERTMKSKDGYRQIAEAFFKSFRLLNENEIINAAALVDDGPDAPWKEFRSEEDGFRILLPAMPKKVSSDVNTSLRKIRQNEYSVKGQRLYFSVVVQDYGMMISDPHVQNNIFDGWQKGFEEHVGSKTTKTELVRLRENSGRSLRIEAGTVIVVARAFLFKDRFYSAAVVYDRGLDNIRDEKKLLDEAAGKFFDSFDAFIPKDLRDLMAQDRRLPEGFFGQQTGNTYHNGHLGLSLSLPDGWVFSPSDDMKMLSKLGKEALTADNPEIAKRLNSKEKGIFLVSKHSVGTSGNPSLAMAVTIEDTSNIDLIGTIRLNEKIYSSVPNSSITTPSATYKVGNRTFAYFERELKSGTYTIKQRIVGTLVRNYVVYFVITYFDEADRGPLLNSLNSISFR